MDLKKERNLPVLFLLSLSSLSLQNLPVKNLFGLPPVQDLLGQNGFLTLLRNPIIPYPDT